MSTVRSPKLLSHWHFGFYNTHAIGAGHLRHSRMIRSSPLRAPLLTLVAGPSPGGSIWTSLGVPIWSLFPSRPFPLPGRPPSPPRLRLGTCPRPGALGMSGLLQWGLLAVCASLVPMQAMACTIHPRPLDFGYLCFTRENPEGYPRVCPTRHTPRLPRIWELTPCPESIISLLKPY